MAVDGDGLAPGYIAHWVVKTARTEEMVAWYAIVFGARIVHQDNRLTFLTWDSESHRLALLRVPTVLRYLLPLAKWRRKFYGIDHIGLTVPSLERLLVTYERLKSAGIKPVWAINHGPTTSLYYEDPDGIRLEFQVENFSTAASTAAFFGTAAFADNPVGVTFDPDCLLEQMRNGAAQDDLVKQGAGTPAGQQPRANRRAVTWRSL